MKILTTGGMGYIGSHTVIALLEAGYEVVILDNLVNASRKVLVRLEQITGRRIDFVEGDVRDRMVLQHVFAEHEFDAVIHFASARHRCVETVGGGSHK